MDIESALKHIRGFRGVTSYDLLPTLNHGEFCVCNTDNILPILDKPEGGHHWLTVCREGDNVLIFDSFGRALMQMAEDYKEPELKQCFLNVYSGCNLYTNTQVIQDRSTAVCGRYAILVAKVFSKTGIDGVLEFLSCTFSHDTLHNDQVMVGGDWQDDLADELHKPKRVHFPRRKVDVYGKDDVWSADLVEMQPFSEYNEGIRYILNVIDIYTKYAWGVPLKSKTGDSVVSAFKTITTNRKPKLLWVDHGSEFYNKTFKEWLKKNDIHMYSTENEGKAVVVERFNRTLKSRMWKHFTARSTKVYIDVLQKLVDNYNNSKHHTIGMTPMEASLGKPIEQLYEPIADEPVFQVGDKVRITVEKRMFAKGYTLNWTEEVFVIRKVLPTYPVTYKVKDLADEPITGSFYKQQLMKTAQATFRIDKVLKRRKGSLLVKWKGYPEKFNQWVSQKEMRYISKDSSRGKR